MERVWDYPRPPALVPCEQRVRVELGDELLADSTIALRILETSHPPTIYIPPADVRLELLVASDAGPSFCEFKGLARYLDAVIGSPPAPNLTKSTPERGEREVEPERGRERRIRAVGWTYPDPSPGYEALRDHVAFYPGRVDAAWLGDERVQAQEGDFYGGWITSQISGPFKGPPGTLGW